MKQFTLIELLAVMVIMSMLLSIVFSMKVGGKVASRQESIGALVERAKMANILTNQESLIMNTGDTMTAKYYEHTNTGTTQLITETININDVLVQIYQGGNPLSQFSFRSFEAFPSGAPIKIEISTPEDKGKIVRINTFTGRLSYYEAVQ